MVYLSPGGVYPVLGSGFVACGGCICAHWGMYIRSLGLVSWPGVVHLRPLGVYIRILVHTWSLVLVLWSVLGAYAATGGAYPVIGPGLSWSRGLVGGCIPMAGWVLQSRRKPFGFVVRSGFPKGLRPWVPV